MNKRGFSLFELMLVVILIGLIYSLVLGKIDKKKTIIINKLENLKSILINSHNNDKIELNIYDNCKKIALKGLNKKIDIDISLFKNIQIYNVDENKNLKEIEFTPIFLKDKVYDVCFNFSIYKNQSSSSYIVKQANKYIVFHSYFKDTFITTDENQAINDFINLDNLERLEDEIF